MSPFHTSDTDSIDAQAALWFTRNRDAHNVPADPAFSTWHAVPAHARAYAEFEALWADLGELERLNKPVPLPVKKTHAKASALPWPRRPRLYVPSSPSTSVRPLRFISSQWPRTAKGQKPCCYPTAAR